MADGAVRCVLGLPSNRPSSTSPLLHEQGVLFKVNPPPRRSKLPVEFSFSFSPHFSYLPHPPSISARTMKRRRKIRRGTIIIPDTGLRVVEWKARWRTPRHRATIGKNLKKKQTKKNEKTEIKKKTEENRSAQHSLPWSFRRP